MNGGGCTDNFSRKYNYLQDSKITPLELVEYLRTKKVTTQKQQADSAEW